MHPGIHVSCAQANARNRRYGSTIFVLHLSNLCNYIMDGLPICRVNGQVETTVAQAVYPKPCCSPKAQGKGTSFSGV